MLEAVMAGLEKEKKLHTNAALHCDELQAEVKKLKEEAIESEQRRRALLDNCNHLQNECNEVKNECNELKKERDGLKKECGDLTITNHFVHSKLESVEMKLKMTINERDTLEKDLAVYKMLTSPLTEKVKQQIIHEYQRSLELMNEVLKQFNLCYQDARAKDKEKMKRVALNADLLDILDDESEA